MPLDTESYVIPVARTVADLRETVEDWRGRGLRVGLVPTMGALHAGHLSLVDLAASQADRVVVSIFVNPTQFSPNEDFNAYPRTEADDAAKLIDAAHLIFAPNAHEMYPEGFSTAVLVSGVTDPLEGQFRPTHFAGVATIVCKLLLQCLPDIAVFGQKDYQQLLVIRRMVADLNIPVEIVGGDILREEDGLAMSSRNAYLSPDERKIAGRLNVILREAVEKIARGALIADTVREGTDALRSAGFDHVDYLDIRNAATLADFPAGRPDASARALVAAKIGKTRLIDNMAVPAE